MKILLKQTPMNYRRKAKNCSRCGKSIEINEVYNLDIREVVCNNCVMDDEYVSGIKAFKGSSEIFWHHGIAWNVEGILHDIRKGRRFEKTTIPLENIKGINHDITIYPERLDEVDVSIPGILIEKSGGSFDIIDGHHRIEKGIKDGVEAMEFYKLSFKEQFEYLIFMSGRELMEYLKKELAR